MRKNTSKKLICLLLAVMMILPVFPSVIYAADNDAKSETTGLQEISSSLKSESYEDYLKRYADVPRGTAEISVDAVDYVADLTNAEVSVVNNYEGKSGSALEVGDYGDVTWKVNVPSDGMYNVVIEFCSVSDKTNSIERVLKINGAVPFYEARYILMTKNWVNEYVNGRFEMDDNGNELRPTASVQHVWKDYALIDSNGYYANPFEFYFAKGENTITLEAVREPVVISKISLVPYEDKLSYEEYVSGKTDAVAEPIHLNAETPSRTSEYTIYPIYDRKSAITEPQDAAKIMLNTIGSEKWTKVGQWIEYDIHVDAAGLYEIILRYRQNELIGMYTSRRIYIDGEVPFEEANYAKFNYNSKWQVEPVGNGADTFKFYLEPGDHTIRFEVTLGEMGGVVRDVSDIMTSINNDYLEIIKLTGATPDSYRDYGFGRILPHVVEDFVIQSRKIDEIVSYIEGMAGIKSDSSATLSEISRLLKKMGTDEDEIAKNIGELKSKIGTLGEWINDAKTQPLEIDYILVQPASADLPKADANFFEGLLYEFKQFIASFFTDYNSLGASSDNKQDSDRFVEVWVTTGRDQAQIVRSLMDNDFGPSTGINATLKLVAGGTLLPSVLAGVGPDVALPGTGVDPINFAIRSAVMPLNPEAYEDTPEDDEEQRAINAERREIFANFDEITERFTESAMIPLTLYGKTYAIPDQQQWPMMFYRTDILADLGLEVPKTWDDLLAMIPVLQFNNMEIGLSQDYTMYMYQLDGELWADNGMRTNLDSNKSLDSFETMCNMFTQYSLPVNYSSANRFRTGEMPIFIGQYCDGYNGTIIFATEIAGLWEFGPVPGFEKEDGTIDNTAMASTSGITIMSGARDVGAAWEYICWYTGKRFQVDYANELVALLGPAAKTPTANMEALEELPWTSREYAQLMKQKDNTMAVPAYPGSYILARYTNFAFLAAYNNNADPVDSLLQYINLINKEITRKRTEFGLETLEIGETLASKRLAQATTAIDELDDAVKASAPVQAALAAIASEDIAELRAAAEGLDTSDEALEQIASYIIDAANALESYIGK